MLQVLQKTVVLLCSAVQLTGLWSELPPEMVSHWATTSSMTPSALGVFHVMRYINVRYLLTYLLTGLRR